MKPKYSICMSNYNMADTLEPSLMSILDQIDDRFELVVVDDGSTDDSVTVIRSLQARYDKLRLVPLERDRKRRLGLTRNISIQEARGEYVMIHLDCDDVYAPFLKDFVEVFHRIEDCNGHDILLSGQHINMGKRQFLLEHGPQRNLSRGGDRDMWVRFAAIGRYSPFEHVDFVTRLPLTKRKQMIKNFKINWIHLKNDFRTGASLKMFLRYQIIKWASMSWKLRFYRLLIVVPARVAAKFETPLIMPKNMRTPEDFTAYREKARGSYSEIMSRHNCDPDLSFLSAAARKIFY